MSNYKSSLQSNNEALSANNLDLQSLIEQANALPDAGGVELPELTNPATQAEIFSGKQVIDEEGNMVTGSFTINEELNAQDSLISQIQSALVGKGAGGGGAVETATVNISINSGVSFTYVSTDGIITIANAPTTVKNIIVPSICYAECTDVFSMQDVSGDIVKVNTPGGSIGIYKVTGSGRIFAASSGGGGM